MNDLEITCSLKDLSKFITDIANKFMDDYKFSPGPITIFLGSDGIIEFSLDESDFLSYRFDINKEEFSSKKLKESLEEQFTEEIVESILEDITDIFHTKSIKEITKIRDEMLISG